MKHPVSFLGWPNSYLLNDLKLTAIVLQDSVGVC